MFVTGPLGGSLQSGRHLTFEPRLESSRCLTESLQVSAMMDISDGLAIDLHRMTEASGCGAVLQHKKIPVHADVCDSLQPGERIERALSDGEDFELLLAVAANDRSRCDAAVAERGLIEIGQMTDTAGEVILRLQDGGSVPLQATGWQHL